MKVIWFLTCLCIGWALNLEAEHAESSSSGTEMYRSNASGGIAVNQRQNGYLEWRFVTTTSCEVLVANVRYSNDGFQDTIRLQVNGSIVGQFTTPGVSQEGNQWNVFKSSGTVGNPVTLSAGQHTLTLIVIMADMYGVDIDKVTLTGPCIVGSSPTENDASTNIPPDTIAATGDGRQITEPTANGSDEPADPTPLIIIGVIGLVIAVPGSIGGLVTAYMCYKKHCGGTNL